MEDTSFDFDNESEYIIIPNPIYDVVFRYLMEDIESAKIVISTLINEKIISLEPQPLTHSEKNKFEEYQNTQSESYDQDLITDPSTKDDIRLFHLDFKAIIELENGEEELVMIELQKASEPNDIFRFKRYISRNFQQKQEKEITDPLTHSIKTFYKPIRLIPIFILNFRIENEINDLLIKINRTKEGIFKGKNLTKHNEFIDNLSYDMYVVQLPNLKQISEEDYQENDYKKNLYALLKLFDQKSKIKNNEHRLRVLRRFFPEFMKRVIRRLQAADINNPNLEEKMYVEDEYLQVLIERDNQISFLQEQKDILLKEVQETKKVSEEAKKQTEEAKKESEEAKKVSEEAKKALEEIKKETENKRKIIIEFALFLKSQGLSATQISEKTNLSIQEIEGL